MRYLKPLMDQNFLEYASYVIKDRAIPDILDGLKPVQRRILHTMREMDDGKFSKVANIVGNTMKLHPHGDASIGSALIVMANKEYFIEKQVLYQTQLEWVQRFIEPAPFSKFYLQLDNETPGRIGSWLGWQIVNSYMTQFPETPLDELLKISSQKLFNLSKYKPNR